MMGPRGAVYLPCIPPQGCREPRDLGIPGATAEAGGEAEHGTRTGTDRGRRCRKRQLSLLSQDTVPPAYLSGIMILCITIMFLFLCF